MNHSSYFLIVLIISTPLLATKKNKKGFEIDDTSYIQEQINLEEEKKLLAIDHHEFVEDQELIKQQKELKAKKIELEKAWGFLKMVKAKSHGLAPLDAHQQFHIAQERLNSIKEELPEGYGDTFIQEFEENWNR